MGDTALQGSGHDPKLLAVKCSKEIPLQAGHGIGLYVAWSIVVSGCFSPFLRRRRSSVYLDWRLI